MTEAVTTIRVVLRGPPQGKGRPRFRRSTGFAYTPERTRSYEGALRHEAALVMGGRKPLSGPLSVVVTAVFQIPQSYSRKQQEAALCGAMRPTKAPDADNLMKVTDAFNGIVWDDDKQVVDARIVKMFGDLPRLEIVVAPIEWPAVAQVSRPLHAASAALPFNETRAA